MYSADDPQIDLVFRLRVDRVRMAESEYPSKSRGKKPRVGCSPFKKRCRDLGAGSAAFMKIERENVVSCLRDEIKPRFRFPTNKVGFYSPARRDKSVSYPSRGITLRLLPRLNPNSDIPENRIAGLARDTSMLASRGIAPGDRRGNPVRAARREASANSADETHPGMEKHNPPPSLKEPAGTYRPQWIAKAEATYARARRGNNARLAPLSRGRELPFSAAIVLRDRGESLKPRHRRGWRGCFRAPIRESEPISISIAGKCSS